ncbi:MAG: radical SAM protein [Elusimicrobia bacterium]|nr:radical SAM protein [Elusimicrobiota bacterium]
MEIIKRFFTWDIHYDCRYRCEYCFFSGKWEELQKKNVYPGIEKWISVWDGIHGRYGSCHVHITGGEPFDYPGIFELTGAIAEKHTLGFDTNLSFDVGRFIKTVKNPEKIGFSNAFHPGYEDMGGYIDKLLKLRDAGCKVHGMNFVAYPPNLGKLAEYRRLAGEKGFNITVMPFRGEYAGREYPGAYTEEERMMIEGKNGSPGDKKEEGDTAAGKPTRDMLDWYGGDRNTREGKLCMMGQVYAKVHPDGNAHRCCMTWENWGLLGNMLEGTFSFYDGPRECPYAECSCPFAMIVGEERRWKDHWQNRTG